MRQCSAIVFQSHSRVQEFTTLFQIHNSEDGFKTTFFNSY